MLAQTLWQALQVYLKITYLPQICQNPLVCHHISMIILWTIHDYTRPNFRHIQCWFLDISLHPFRSPANPCPASKPSTRGPSRRGRPDVALRPASWRDGKRRGDGQRGHLLRLRLAWRCRGEMGAAGMLIFHPRIECKAWWRWEDIVHSVSGGN